MSHRHDAGSGSINRRDTARVCGEYAAWLAEQPLSTRTREAYLAAVSAFVWRGLSSATRGRGKHSTDTAGYSDIIFGLFDLLGLQFAPRLAGLADTRLWYVGTAHDSPAGRTAAPPRQAQPDRRAVGRATPPRGVAARRDRHREPARRTAAAKQRRSRLAAALQDYGRLIKTEFILRYLTHPPDRRGIHRHLNKHESINALEDAVFYGNEGRIRLQTIDRQSTQAAALALVSAAIIT